MSNPCCHGFKCPYRGYGEEGDYICTHPIPVEDTDEDDYFFLAEEVECPLTDRNGYCNEPTVFDILTMYEYDIKVSDSIDKGYERMLEQSREIIKEIKAREREKERNKDV